MKKIKKIIQWFMYLFGYRYFIIGEYDKYYLLAKYNKITKNIKTIKYWSELYKDEEFIKKQYVFIREK